MGVLLQGFYKTKPNNAVPSPADGDPSVPFWWDHLASQANEFRQAGFTAVWLPPVLKAGSGAGPGADGYGAFDDYDIGSRHQKGTTPTRFGARGQLQRCVATLRANGLDVYLDMVEHQRSGDTTPPFVFRYPGADGTPDAGRFPKNPSNFLLQVPRDPNLGGPPSDDFPFGRELAPINARPLHYVFDNLIAAADWLTRGLDAQGYRIDDVKGLSTDFLRPFLESKSMAGKFAVGEFFDGNRILVNQWIFNPKGMNGRPCAFDFPLKFVLNAMCNNPGNFNMSDLDHVGLVGISPASAVTFVENHDTDISAGQSIVINKMLGYAYILTSEGYPCVYYRDYDMGPDGFKLKPKIDNLIWIHEKLASGVTQQRFKDFDVFAYERMSGPHLLVGLNNDPGGPRTITVATGFGRNVALHDYTGHAPDAATDGNGNATITIPKNDNGLGYVCYSVEGQGGGFEITTHSVTQDFEGAADLDILPALAGKPVQAGTVWCAANSTVQARLKPDTTGWTGATAILLEILSPDGSVLAQESFTLHTPGTGLQATTRAEGFQVLRLTASNTPATNSNPAYTLSVTYTAPTVFTQPAAPALHAAALAQGPNPAQVGQWSDVIKLANVPIHTHVLPTGKVLFWGRRNPPGTTDFDSLNQHATLALIWDPANPQAAAKPTGNQPSDSKGNSINLFCSGHTFLADGRLLVTGGHIFDSLALNTSTFYDPAADRWSAGPVMNNGRWYPTAVTLPDGRAFVCSGSFPTGPLPLQPPPNNPNNTNNISQVLENGVWHDLTNFTGLPLFPRFHVAPNGDLFMSGSLATSYLFENVGHGNLGTWVPIATRSVNNADYAPSVMYDVGKVIFIGGGGGTTGGVLPSNIAETIDLNAPNPSWAVAAQMKFHRRQHNATILPDGTVFVTGGSQAAGFDSLGPGQPVHTPELWDPHSGTWTPMADEAVDRCYHSTAVLLPDGRVFSGGGGEYAPVENVHKSNPPTDTHADAQLFSPPYLFGGARPSITNAPTKVVYGQAFDVETPAPGEIGQVTWVRLSSVTHSFNQNQRINFLAFQRGANKVTVTAPANGNVCPPGHYMLFLLNQQKVPSIAAIVQIDAAAAPLALAPAAATAAFAPFQVLKQKTPIEQDADIQAAEKQPPVVVGVTATCPYGISACWGSAYESLTHMHGVRLVRPVPNAQDSTAFVYLAHEGLPDLDSWPGQFATLSNGSHIFRGVEVTVTGSIETRAGDRLVIDGNDTRPPLLLQPIEPADKIQWDATAGAPKALDPLEQDAYTRLLEDVKTAGGSLDATVTGPLRKDDDRGYVLEVRQFSVPVAEKSS